MCISTHEVIPDIEKYHADHKIVTMSFRRSDNPLVDRISSTGDSRLQMQQMALNNLEQVISKEHVVAASAALLCLRCSARVYIKRISSVG